MFACFEILEWKPYPHRVALYKVLRLLRSRSYCHYKKAACQYQRTAVKGAVKTLACALGDKDWVNGISSMERISLV